MKTSRLLAIAALSAMVLILSGLATAADKKEADEEKKLTTKDLPAVVLSAFEKSYPKATIKGVGSETEGGVTYFEIESVDSTLKRDLLYTPDGKAVEIEETVGLKDLPEAARQTIAKDYPKREMKKAEKAMRDAAVTYDVTIGEGKDKVEVTFDAAGKVLKTTQVGKEKEEGDND